MQECPNCGAQNPVDIRRCRTCGRPLAPAPRDWEQRKTVTVLFADIIRSTALGERLDPESLRRVLSRFFMEMSATLQRHGGSVEKFIGDAVMAIFGVPTIHEDDALRAVRAASEMRMVLNSLNEELRRAHGVSLEIRIGVNTGTVVVGELVAGQSFVSGDAVNVAARLEQAAPPGEILLGEETYRLVRDVVVAEPTQPMQLRNREEAVTSYKLLDVDDRGARRAAGLSSPMVGRISELSALLDVLDQVARDRTPHVVTVLGSAGVGKSRLVEEFIAGSGDRVRALSGRCLSYGEGITFWPVAEVVREAIAVPPDAAAQDVRARLAVRMQGVDHADRIEAGVAQMMGLGDAAGSQEQMFWGTRRFLEREAEEKPLVVALDDIHWGEPTFLDFIEYLTDFASGPLCVVCTARLDLLDERPGWGTGRRNTSTVTLEPLREDESLVLIRNLLRDGALKPSAGRHVSRASEGNPLFIEEMLRMMIDEGILLEEDDGRWTVAGDIPALSAPPTIQAVLSARLERLEPEERAVLQRASLVGKVFSWEAVSALTPEPDRSDVGPALRSLVRKELIVPEPAASGRDAFRFRHLLVQDAAYTAIPKEIRADLHERLAGWLEDRPEGDPTHDEIVGHHLEVAYRLRSELAPSDERDAQLAERASTHLAAAGRRAFARGDVPAAGALLPRAAELLAAGHPERPALLVDAGQALIERGELERADDVLTEAMDAARALGDHVVEATARLTRLLVRLSTMPQEAVESISSEIDEVAPVLEAAGDARGLARVARLRAELDWVAGRYLAVEGQLDAVIEHARRAGDPRLEMDALAQLAAAVLYGPTPADEGIRRCREIHARAGGDRRVEAAVLTVEAELRAMQGRFEGTREQIRRAREIYEDLGMRFRSRPSEAMASVEMLAGDPEAAHREFMSGYETLEQIGERGFLSTTAAELAQVAWARGAYDEAERFVRISEESGASDDIATIVPARSVRAKLLARAGDAGEAERFALEAVRTAERTDNLNLIGEALSDLGLVLGAIGKHREASEVLERAAATYEEKGNLVSAQRVRERIALPGTPTSA